jgi:hypothetical protein
MMEVYTKSRGSEWKEWEGATREGVEEKIRHHQSRRLDSFSFGLNLLLSHRSPPEGRAPGYYPLLGSLS